MRVIGNTRASRPLLKITHSDDVDRIIERLDPSDELREYLTLDSAPALICAHRLPTILNWIPIFRKMTVFLN